HIRFFTVIAWGEHQQLHEISFTLHCLLLMSGGSVFGMSNS
ncbi:hypothetical protein L917_13787, partial [Phytophthora nicotianae]